MLAVPGEYACLAVIELPEIAIGDFIHVETCQANPDNLREG